MQYLTDQHRYDISRALEIWKNIISEYTDAIYVYAHGSAIKEWESDIDYVPMVSDVDLHIFPVYETIFDDESSWEIPLEYEKRFTDEPFSHIPRINIKNIKDLMTLEDMVFQPPENVKILSGQPPSVLRTEIENEEIRAIDHNNLIAMKGFYPRIPEMVWDRTEIEFWIVLRQLTWRVSPTPVRLLTQLVSNPKDAWNLNRTQLMTLLEEYNLYDISDNYRSFYLEGWKLYSSGLKDSKNYMNMIKSAYDLFRLSVNELEKIKL